MALAISEVTFPLTIWNISKLDRVQSSEIIFFGVPNRIFQGTWLVKIFSRRAKEDNSSQWSYAAQTSVKLLSFWARSKRYGDAI